MKERAIIVSRCSTNENRQDVTRQSEELRAKYGNTYVLVKEFSYYQSGTKNDHVNDEILEYAIANNVKHIIALEISRISRKISSFALFLENCNSRHINIIIDNFGMHTLLPDGTQNAIIQSTLSIASAFSSMELSLIKSRLDSGREKYIRDGGKLGRKVGSTESDATTLQKHSDVVKYLRQGQSVRITMKLTGKSSGTVQKVKRILSSTKKAA